MNGQSMMGKKITIKKKKWIYNHHEIEHFKFIIIIIM